MWVLNLFHFLVSFSFFLLAFIHLHRFIGALGMHIPIRNKQHNKLLLWMPKLSCWIWQAINEWIYFGVTYPVLFWASLIFMRFVFSEEGYIPTCWYIYLWYMTYATYPYIIFSFSFFNFSFLLSDREHNSYTHIWLNSWYDFHTVFMEAGNAFGLETIGILNHYHYPCPYNDWCYGQGASYCKCSRWKKWKQNKE